jgi:LysR family hydrogen peroxide-inducible transcriptional activator
MKPSIRQLQYAVAVADLKSFRRAAEACHVSQPALSTQIKELEEGLGVRLFERDRRKVIVTAAGEAVIPRAREVLLAVDELVGASHLHSQPLTGVLQLGVIPTIAPYLLPRTLPGVRKRYPNLRLLLVEDQTANLIRRLESGELDLLLLALEADLGNVETLSIFQDDFLLAAPIEHELGTRSRIKESDLAGREILLLEDGHCLRDQVLSVCKIGGAHELGDFRASSLNTLTQMVAHGIGVTLIPSMAVPTEVTPRSRLKVLPFIRPRPHRTIGFAWRKTSPRKEEFHLLAELFKPR